MVEVTNISMDVLPSGRPGREFILVLALVDCLLIWSWLAGAVPTLAVVALHGAAALAVGAFELWHRAHEDQPTLVLVMLALLFGPVGGIMLAVASPLRSASPGRRAAILARMADRIEPIRPAVAICAQIRQGRRHPDPGRAPTGFIETFRSGNLQAQQAAIAAISRSYHPGMRAALTAALASSIPAVRVQATAVFARQRAIHEDRAREILSLAGTDALPFDHALIRECIAIPESGFVDAGTSARLGKLAAQGVRLVPAGPEPGGAERPEPEMMSLPAIAGSGPISRPGRVQQAFAQPPRLRHYSCGGLA